MTTASAQSHGDEAPEASAALGNPPDGQGGATQGQGESNDRAATEKAAQHQALRKLRTWFLFAVFFAVMPTLGKHLGGLQRPDYESPSILVLAAKADLFVVSMGLSATAIAQAFDRERSNALNFWNSLNIVILGLTSLLAATSSADGVSAARVGLQSLIILAVTLVSAGRSTYLCELEAKP
ncbi:hypothetical protein [Streptomyces sp. NPDC058989]|uniref:hypothetical protein n=1 Tax=Streptomyces sp. NPDC058989 TaxID=3346686 RepID=UPI0036B49193